VNLPRRIIVVGCHYRFGFVKDETLDVNECAVRRVYRSDSKLLPGLIDLRVQVAKEGVRG
jgi:hypothetical protein